MSPDSDSPYPQPEDQYERGINRYRASLRWVVSAFGAVAAVLVVGLQLSSLGHVHGWKLHWALASVAAVFSAILAIIITAVHVLEPVEGTYTDFAEGRQYKALRKFLKRDPSPLRNKAGTAEELAEKFHHLRGVQRAAWEAFTANEDDAGLNEAYLRAKDEYDSLKPTVEDVTSFGLFICMKQRFKRVMIGVYAAIVVAAAGATAFAYFSTPPAQAQPKQPPQIIYKKVIQAPPPNCASYYFTLDELADDEPNIGSRWPMRSPDAQAIACGLHNKRALAHFLTYLGRK